MRLRWRERATGTTIATPVRNERDKPEVAFAEVLLDEGREELSRADGKASMLLVASGVVFGVLVGAGVNGKWTPQKLNDHPTTAWIFWVGVGLAVFGLVLVAWAVLPRTKHSGDRSQLAYFGHVVRYREKGLAVRRSSRVGKSARSKLALKKAIVEASAGTFDRTVDQVCTVSLIVYKKYRRIRYGLIAYGFATALCTGAAIVNHFL